MFKRENNQSNQSIQRHQQAPQRGREYSGQFILRMTPPWRRPDSSVDECLGASRERNVLGLAPLDDPEPSPMT